MKYFKQILLFIPIFWLCSCAAIFLPKKQNVIIRTNNKESSVYVDKEEVGKGKVIETRIKKGTPKQIVIQTPGYKDAYFVLPPSRRSTAFWIFFVLDIPTLYGCSFDPYLPKSRYYNADNKMESTNKYIYKTPNQKYLDLSSIKMNIVNKEKDLNDYYVGYSKDLDKTFAKAEKNRMEFNQKQDAKNKRKKGKTLDTDDNKIQYDDTKFSETLYKTLKKSGFVDTVNHVFSDNTNTLQLEGVIRKADVFHITSMDYSRYNKARINILWNIQNTFGETLDSIVTQNYSGEYYNSESNKDQETFQRMFADAVDNSYSDLFKNERFLKYLKLDSAFKINDPVLTIGQPKSVVEEISDASAASVIIKRSDKGHGSGFAITNDGYIITNFHVIAGKTTTKLIDFKVLLSSGEEVPAKVVRFNRMRDIALLKVDQKFEKAFRLSNEKTYKNLQEVYTIGAPKSVELGQSISMGLLSNERKSGKKTLLQVNMSINPGNSGGPLFDKNGKLHGIVTSKLVGYATEGVGFAIPACLVSEYLNLSLK